MNDNQKMSRRAFLRASSMVAMGAALAACAPVGPAGSAPAGDAAAAPSAEKITLRMHARIGQQEDTLYDMQIPKFTAENPNIEVIKESFPGGEFNAKISTMVAGGTLGDTVWSALGGATIQFAYAQNTVQAVDDLVASLTRELKRAFEDDQPIGVLGHHLVHDEAAWEFLDELMQLTSHHDSCRWNRAG